MSHFQHPTAIVETTHVGSGTRIWAFTHVLPGAVIGADCNLCDHVFVENDVRIGDRVTVKCGVQLWNGVTIEEDVFIGPNATFTNDVFPRSRVHHAAPTPTLIKAGASVGANATILPGVTVGRQAMVGAGAVVTHDVPAFAIVTGNPAVIVGYVSDSPPHDVLATTTGVAEPHEAVGIRGVAVRRLGSFEDLRGRLAVQEFAALPFVPRRVLILYDVPTRQVRGERASRTQSQLLLCVRGECTVLVDDGTRRCDVRLQDPTLALHLEPLVWTTLYRFSPDATLVILASGGYDPGDYVRDYEEFRALAVAAAPARAVP